MGKKSTHIDTMHKVNFVSQRGKIYIKRAKPCKTSKNLNGRFEIEKQCQKKRREL